MPPAAPVVSLASDTDPTGETLAINLSGELALAMRGNFEKLADFLPFLDWVTVDAAGGVPRYVTVPHHLLEALLLLCGHFSPEVLALPPVVHALKPMPKAPFWVHRIAPSGWTFLIFVAHPPHPDMGPLLVLP